MQEKMFFISDAAKQSGVSSANIRYYEREGLLSRQARSSASYRLYREEDIHQLRFIRRLRDLDMSLSEMRQLLGLNLRNKLHCEQARSTIDEHLGHVRHRLKELRALEKDLANLRARCDGQGERCHLIEALHAQAKAPRVAGKGSAKKHHHGL